MSSETGWEQNHGDDLGLDVIAIGDEPYACSGVVTRTIELVSIEKLLAARPWSIDK